MYPTAYSVSICFCLYLHNVLSLASAHFQGQDPPPPPPLSIALTGGAVTDGNRTASDTCGKHVSGPTPSLGPSLPSSEDTEHLVAEASEEKVGAQGSSGQVGSSPRGSVPLGKVILQHSLTHEGEIRLPLPPPPDYTRREIQRQMEDLRDELRDGQSQWEVHEQIGQGGFGVVYKVGGGVGGSLGLEGATKPYFLGCDAGASGGMG